MTPDKRYVKDDGTCATGKTCKAIQKPSLAGDWAGKNIDMPGGDYTNFNLNSEHPSDCRDACVKDSQCKAWTYVKPGVQGPKARCWLKSSVPPARSNTCCISEVIERGGIKVN